MLTKVFLSAGLVALASVSPLSLTTRGCTAGLFNCLDGKTYQQCIAGGTWSVTMPVAPGTSCHVGISPNPWLAVGSAPVQPTSVPISAPTSISMPTPSSSPTKSSLPSPSSAQPASATASSSCVNIESMDKWLTWEQMKQKYTSVLGTSCQSSWQVANNSLSETQEVFNAIEAQHGTVDPRFVLAIVVQESSGCVRVPTTNNGVRNPGLMQDSNGKYSCNDGGVVQNPCPANQINGMIRDGISGGANNYEIALASAGSAGYKGAMQYAVSARIYNSGSFDANDLCNGITSTASYVSDIIERLEGSKL